MEQFYINKCLNFQNINISLHPTPSLSLFAYKWVIWNFTWSELRTLKMYAKTRDSPLMKRNPTPHVMPRRNKRVAAPLIQGLGVKKYKDSECNIYFRQILKNWERYLLWASEQWTISRVLWDIYTETLLSKTLNTIGNCQRPVFSTYA